MSRRHPSSRKLREWLDSGEPTEVDAHVSTCEKCASQLDDLAAPMPALHQLLSTRLAPPEDLLERLTRRLSVSAQNREDLQIVLDLFGAPWFTAQNLLLSSSDDEETTNG